MWGRGQEGAMALAPLCQTSLTPSATHNQIGPFWCCFPSRWVCVCSRPLWVSPRNSPVRLGVSPAAASPTGFSIQKLRLSFSELEPWVAWSVSLPSCSSQFIRMQMWDHLVCQPPPCCVFSTVAAHFCPSYQSG